MARCFHQPFPSSRSRTSSSSPTCFSRSTSSSRGIAQWWATRSRETASSEWRCCGPGYQADYEGRPPVYEVGCAGVITHSQPLADGRYDIVLRGIEKFRITSEDASRPYRIGYVDALSEVIPAADVQPLRHQRQRLEAVLAAAVERVRAEPKFPPSVPDEDLVNALAQYLDLDAVEHQALLECNGVLARCRALIELLEMKIHAPRGGWPGNVFH